MILMISYQLKFEHLLLTPGTTTVMNGRTMNTNLLKTNFQKSWKNIYLDKIDQDFFSKEKPFFLKWNKKQLRFYNKK